MKKSDLEQDSLLNFDFKNPNCINLRCYFKPEVINEFLNGEISELIIDPKIKSQIFLKIIKGSETLQAALKKFENLKIHLIPLLVQWLKNNFKNTKNNKNLEKWWAENFDKSVFYKKDLSFFLIQQAKSYQSNATTGYSDLFILSNFISSKKSTLKHPAPLFLQPISLKVNKDRKIIIIKTGPLIYNVKFLKKNELIYNAVKNQNNFFSKKYLSRFKNFIDFMKLEKSNGILANQSIEMDHNFFIFRLNVHNKNFDLQVLNQDYFLPEKFDINVQNNLVTTDENFSYEKIIESKKHKKIITFNGLNYLNSKNLFRLFFKHVIKNERVITFFDDYVFIKWLFKSDSPLKKIMFFNLTDLQQSIFYQQILDLEANLKNDKKFLLEKYAYTDKKDLDNLDTLKKVYDFQSLNQQDWNESLNWINTYNFKNNFSEWAKVGFSLAKKYSVTLNSLLEKIQIIHDLNIEYRAFLEEYGYEDFWKNLDKHKEFLIEYDEPSRLKVLYYLSVYIESKIFPPKVVFFTRLNTSLSEQELANLYKLFYNAVNSDLFYVSEKEISLLLNEKLKNETDFLALVNYDWMKNNLDFKKYFMLPIFNEIKTKIYSKTIYLKNVEFLVNNYFVNLNNRIKFWSDKDKDLLKDLFYDAKNKQKMEPSLFLDKYWKILTNLFPIWITLTDNLLASKSYLTQVKFNTSIACLTENRKKEELELLQETGDYLYWLTPSDASNVDDKFQSFLNDNAFADVKFNFDLFHKNQLINLFSKNNAICNNYLSLGEQPNLLIHEISKAKHKDNFNISEIDTLIKRLIKLIESQSDWVFGVLVKELKIKNYLLQLLLGYKVLIKALYDGRLVIFGIDDNIHYVVDCLLITLNDSVWFLNYIDLKKSYLSKDSFTRSVANFLKWTQISCELFLSFSQKEVFYINNKNTVKFLKDFYDYSQKYPKKAILAKKDNLLIKNINAELEEIIKSEINLKTIKVEFNHDLGFKNNLIILKKENKILLIINLIYNQSQSFESVLDYSYYLRKRKYPILDIFIYDWIFKKEQVLAYLMRLMQKLNLTLKQEGL